MNNDQKKKKGSFFDIIKNLFWLLLFLQFAPIVFSNLKNNIEEMLSPKSHVGQLTINGFISDSSFYIHNIHKFLKDPEIKALLLKIDSSGGFPGSAQAIFNELNKFKEKKPVVALVENTCASAAYNIAAASNYIISSPSALIGSIGVWLQMPPNVKGLTDDWKIKFRHIQSGKYKTTGSPFKDDAPEEISHLQKVSDDSYNQFVKEIAQSRNLSLKNQGEWADGKVFTGNQALKLNLIDQIGSLQNAIDEIKKEALIENEIKLIHPKKTSQLMKLFGTEEEYNTPYSNFSSFVATTVNQIIDQVATTQTSKASTPEIM